MKKKFTIIVIGNKRRIYSIEISSARLITLLAVIIGLILMTTTTFMVYNYTREARTEKVDSPNSRMASTNQKPENASQDMSHQDGKILGSANISSHKLTIQNLKATYDPQKKSFRYKFFLKNLSENATISGYTFVILKSGVSDSTPWLVFPKTVISDGAPQNFKEGDFFSISRGKVISNHIPTPNIYDSVLIYVFSNDGNLILKESFNIKGRS